MSDRKGAWKRKDRVVLGQGTARRAGKLGYVGEQLAMAELSGHGFTDIEPLNHPKKNHPFADIYAERDGEKLWISVKTRNKYQTDGSLNYCYKISPREKEFSDRLEQGKPGTEAACIGVSVVVSQNSCRDGEPPNSYSCYFAKLRSLTDQQGIGMRKRQLPHYECFRRDEDVLIRHIGHGPDDGKHTVELFHADLAFDHGDAVLSGFLRKAERGDGAARAMIRERTSAGLAAARAEGRIGGRRKKLDAAKRREIAESVVSGRKSGAEMARLYGVSQPTVSRIVAVNLAGPTLARTSGAEYACSDTGCTDSRWS